MQDLVQIRFPIWPAHCAASGDSSHTTYRDASGRIIGSSSGTGKCQDVAKVPVPPAGAKK
jgi:hypothetical protein